MKFFSVAVVVVLFCAVIVYAAPSTDAEDSVDNEIKTFREKLQCYDESFIELAAEYKGLDKLYVEFKVGVEETKLELDECEKIDTPESKEECVSDAKMSFSMMNLESLLIKLRKKNEELPNQLVSRC